MQRQHADDWADQCAMTKYAPAVKLEAAMKGMVAEVAKNLEKGQAHMGTRVADMFTILWYEYLLDPETFSAHLSCLDQL